jgi:hypothetical protein
MTPKEKAIELINEYLQIYDGKVIEASKCALIAVNLALGALDEHQWQNQHVIAEYNQIKKEIENYG